MTKDKRFLDNSLTRVYNNEEEGRIHLMIITLNGKIEKQAIKLPEWVRIPDGIEVKVMIEKEMTKEEKRRFAESLCGAWSNDSSIDSIFEEIERERHKYPGREVNLNVFA
ncbi:MAG: hypothetical protein AB1797_10870 [bacterium]